MPVDTLFGRRARIIVGTSALVVGDADDGLHVAFNVEKTLKPEPNKAEIRIWNLAKTHAKAIEQMASVGPIGVPVQIEAGYQQPSLIYRGGLREAYSVEDGPDTITTLTTGDGEKAYQTSRINTSLPKGTSIIAALTQLAAQLQIPIGNLATMQYSFFSGAVVFANGWVFSGSAAWEMTSLLAACGKEWSIQDGQIQVLNRGKTLLNGATVLSAETGMVDAPSVSSKGELKARMLITPDVYPGRLLVAKTVHIQGAFRIEKCTYTGDTHGNDWCIDITAKRLGVA
jgi:hypothetical protein